jgi:hypothetical protein
VTMLYQGAWELWRFLQDNHGPITAFATAALAIFTTTLWWATRKLVKAGPRIERAYISAGGVHRFRPMEKGSGSGEYFYTPTGQFQFHVNNYGKTPGRVYAIGWGWCEEIAIPVDGPKYQTRYFDSWIEPGRSGLPLLAIKIPMWEEELARPVIYGRVFYETIFGDRFSSGFLYRVPKDEPRDSESIPPPHPSYTEYRKEKAGRVATLRARRLWRSWRRGSLADHAL